MTTPENNGGVVVVERVRELEEFCSSEELSVEGLRHKLSGIQSSPLGSEAIRRSSILHRICENEKVTLEMIEIVKHIVDTFPELVSMKEVCIDGSDEVAYPLHVASGNRHCPTPIIQALIEANPSVLRESSRIFDDEDLGLPIHRYLGRRSNIDCDVVKMMIEAYPQSLAYGATDADGGDGSTPLHIAIVGKSCVSPAIVQLIVDHYPQAIRMRSGEGKLPIHILCENEDLDGRQSEIILDILVNADQQTVMERYDGSLPVHCAVKKSLKFLAKIVELYPEGVWAQNQNGELPFHMACLYGRLDSAKYLLELHPESVRVRGVGGDLPIHYAARGEGNRNGVIQYLLSLDPSSASIAGRDKFLPLHYAVFQWGGANVRQLKILFDAYPDAIYAINGDGRTPVDISRRLGEQSSNSSPRDSLIFLENQLAYANKARDVNAMHSLDSDGRLPLHRAILDQATLGAIKLLVKGNPTAVRAIDNLGRLPFHIACGESTVGVVKYLVELNDSCFDVRDKMKNSPLHHACKHGNGEVLKYLLKASNMSYISKRNSDGKLPIHLLLEWGESSIDALESPEHVESIWLMLRACPDLMRNF